MYGLSFAEKELLVPGRKPNSDLPTLNPELLLALAFDEGAGPIRNLTDGRTFSWTGNPTWSQTKNGIAVDFTAGSSQGSNLLTDRAQYRATSGGGFTILAISSATSNSGFVLLKGATGGAGYDYAMYRNGSGNLQIFGGTNTGVSSTLAWGTALNFAAVGADGGGSVFFMNGAFQTGASIAVTSSTHDVSVGYNPGGGGGAGGNFQSNGQHVQILVVGRKLSQAEILQWYADPWGYMAGRYHGLRADYTNRMSAVAGNPNVSLAAVSATGAVGAFGVEVDEGFGGVSGNAAVVGLGSQLNFGLSAATASGVGVGFGSQVAFSLQSVSSTGAAGSFSAVAGNLVSLVGVAASGAAAAFGIEIDVGLVAVAATAAVGSLTGSIAASLTAASAIGAVASFIPSATTALGTVAAAAGVAAFSISGGFLNVALAGVAAIGAAASFLSNRKRQVYNKIGVWIGLRF